MIKYLAGAALAAIALFQIGTVLVHMGGILLVGGTVAALAYATLKGPS